MSSQRVVAIVQARMTSSRLPGKVLAEVGGKPMLAQQLRRLFAAKRLDAIVVATTNQRTDDPICMLAESLGVAHFRGSEDDVLSRFADASRIYGADVVVRVTADCPLLDPAIVDRVACALLDDDDCDYASNVIERSFPQGLDVEVIRAKTLAAVAEAATSEMAREHVTWAISRERPADFNIRSVRDPDDHSELRWTVDTAEDLAFIRRIYRELDLTRRLCSYREILEHVTARPELSAINQHIVQRHL